MVAYGDFFFSPFNNTFHCVLLKMHRCLLTRLNASGTKAGSICVHAWLSKKQGQTRLLFAKAVFAALKLLVSLEFGVGGSLQS